MRGWSPLTDHTFSGLGSLLYETDSPFARGFPRGLRELVVKVDRTALADRSGTDAIRRPVMAFFRGDTTSNQYARALATIANRATRTGEPRIAGEEPCLT